MDYLITLPTGEKKRVVLKSEPKQTVMHLISGTSGLNHTVDRSMSKKPSVLLKNLANRLLGKPVITVEERADQIVEKQLQKYGVQYEKIAFEDLA